MRRLPIFLAFAFVFALFVVAAATAAPPTDFCGSTGTKPAHPSCETTPPQVEDCFFDDAGVLEGWSGTGEQYRCKWTPLYPAATYSFQIQSETVER